MSNDSETWRRIEKILDEVFELPPAAWPAFLDRACLGEPELRARVEVLLAADDRSKGLLDHTAGAVASLADDRPSDAAGRRVGPYVILRKCGEGGMGVVFEARQESPDRIVALKLIRGMWASDQDVRAFRREIRSLARLDHPGIAAIYDAGRTPEGEDYFAMELVAGLPLDEYLQATPFDPRDRKQLHERLELFLRICGAIAYAHQRGVIHRDLKPSNILVTQATDPATSRPIAQPKVLDFGLAREMDSDATLTDVGRVRGTLAYMSPEQALGQSGAIDARSDVYALGVILYFMLVGRLPYDVRGRALPDAIRVVAMEQPVPPSGLNATLRGDLETIVLHALEKTADQRYASVPALADDVRRFLSDEPILARPPSTVYQLRKFARRHRAALAVASMLFALVVAFGVTMSVMYRRQLRATATAELQTKKAERTVDFLRKMLGSANPANAKGHEFTVRELLDRSSATIDSSFAGEDEVRGSIQRTIGETYLELGVYDEAEKQLRAAVETLERKKGRNDKEVLNALNRLAMVLFYQAKGEEMEAVARRAAEASQAVYGPSKETAMALSAWGLALNRLSRLAPAESTFRASIAMLHEVHADTGAALAVARNNLGAVLRTQEKFEDALSEFSVATAAFTGSYGPDHPETLKSRYNVGLMLARLQRFEEASDTLRAVLEAQRRILGPSHPNTLRTQSFLGDALHGAGKNADAEALLVDARDRLVQGLGPDHVSVAMARYTLARFLADVGKLSEAEREYREGARIRGLTADGASAIADNLAGLGVVLAAEGRRDEALRNLREAAALFAQSKGEDHVNTKEARAEIARIEADADSSRAHR